MVAFVDFVPTMLSLAGIESPACFHGSEFFGLHAGEARQFAFGCRDRMDEHKEFVRLVRSGRAKCIRNYLQHLPWFP